MDAIGHLKYAVNIIDKKMKTNIRSVTIDSEIQMAPNSTYDFSIDLGNKYLVEGDYALDLVVSDAKENEWKFNEDFTISAKEAKDINEITVDFEQKKELPLWVLFMKVGFIIVVLILIIIVVLKQKNGKRNNLLK